MFTLIFVNLGLNTFLLFLLNFPFLLFLKLLLIIIDFSFLILIIFRLNSKTVVSIYFFIVCLVIYIIKLKEEKLEPKQSFTEPPPRYTEASLVKALEEKGIRKTKYLFTYNYNYFRKKIYRKRTKTINTNRFRKNCK